MRRRWLGYLVCRLLLNFITVGASLTAVETNEIGQPELVESLPMDPASFNHLSPIPYASGTYHFVSSTFPEIDSRGFHESVFDGIGDYIPSWQSVYYKRGQKSELPGVKGGFRSIRKKRSAAESSKDNDSATQEFEDDVKRSYGSAGRRHVRGMEMGSSGFHGDVFNSGFGDFMTMKKRAESRNRLTRIASQFLRGGGGGGGKRAPPEMTALGFHGDTFSRGFGDFDTMKKRRPEMDSMGFHGDTFSRGFGEFDTMKKRRPEMDSMGFHGDTFSRGFGEFDTMKKRRPEMDSMGFHGDTFSRGFGEFDTMKKRRPEMDSMGFHGDTFSRGFGDFDTMKKRRPEMDSMGFHGDTFSRGFGDFDTMKKRLTSSSSHISSKPI